MQIIPFPNAGIKLENKPPFEDLYSQYWSKVYFYIFKKIGVREDAEDLAEEAFLYAYDRYDRFDPDKSSVGTWLFIIVNSRLKDHYRARKSHVDISELENSLFEEGDELDKAVWLEQVRTVLTAAIDTLPARQQDVVRMKYFQNMSHEDIAKALNTSPGNARVLLSRALDKLKEQCRSIM